MKAKLLAWAPCLAILVSAFLGMSAQAALTTNNFIGTTSGAKWETAGNWSAGQPTFGQSLVRIADGVSVGLIKTVAVDSTTVSTAPGSLVVSNLTIANSGSIQNVLWLNNLGTGTLEAFDILTVSIGAAVSVSNSVLEVGPSAVFQSAGLIVDGSLTLNGGTLLSSVEVDVGIQGPGQLTTLAGTWLAQEVNVGVEPGISGAWNMGGGTATFSSQLVAGFFGGSTGHVWITGGLLQVTNAITYVGFFGVGQITISNGTWKALQVIVGETNGAPGTLTIAGGTNLYTGLFTSLIIGDQLGVTGNVWITGGALLLSNFFGDAEIGNGGSGFLTQSNGFVHIFEDDVGELPGGQGTLTIAGGTHVIDGGLYIGDEQDATGTVWITGGQLIITNNASFIGNEGIGQLTVSNGAWFGRNVFVGDFDGATGTITVSGGSSTLSSNLVLGDCSVDAEGFLVVNAGALYITNASHTATLNVQNGEVLMTGGTLVVDKLIVTNACGLFVHDGGTLVVGTTVLAPGLDADGDGFSNAEETGAGTDPLNPNSTPFRITSIVRKSNDVLVTWTTTGGKWNWLQVTKGAPGGSYSNNFTNLSPMIVPPGSALTSTSYLDVGGATNIPSRYYRILLVP